MVFQAHLINIILDIIEGEWGRNEKRETRNEKRETTSKGDYIICLKFYECQHLK